MEKNKKLLGAGILTAVTASLCCITPILALAAGVGGLASTFSWVEPLRPYLIGTTVLVLGFAWYGQLKPKKDIDCECEEDEKKSFFQSTAFLALVTIFAAVMLAFPYYSESFYPEQQKREIVQTNLVTADLKISGMTCEGCEANIKNYAEFAGADSVKADYKTGTAVIKFNEAKTNIDSIVKSIKLLGYEVKDAEIEK